MGAETQAGCKGYYIAAIDPDNNHIYLHTPNIDDQCSHTANGIVIPTWEDNPSRFYDESFESDYQILENISYGNEFSVSADGYYHWPFAGNIIKTDKNRLTYISDTLNTSDKWLSNVDNGADPCIFFIPAQSNIGLINVGLGAVAEGWNTHAAAQHSHTEGYGTIAAGRYGHAEGNGTRAGFAAHAEGVGSLAQGHTSHAEGGGTKAIGERSHAEGDDTEAIGGSSHAEGGYTKAIGVRSHAEGHYTEAIGEYSHAENARTKAKGKGSHAEGSYTIADGWYQHVQGVYNDNSGEDEINTGHPAYNTNNPATGKYAHIIGNGKKNAPSNAYTLDWGGNGWFAGNITLGTSKAKVATETVVDTKIKSSYITAGRKSGSTIGAYSTAEGNDVVASQSCSHAEGGYTVAHGKFSHAEGGNKEYLTLVITGDAKATTYTLPKPNKDIVVGQYIYYNDKYYKITAYNSSLTPPSIEVDSTLSDVDLNSVSVTIPCSMAYGDASHAEGYQTVASGLRSHAEGHVTVAQGDYSHAENAKTKALAKGSHAEGSYTIANSEYQHVQGKYNIEDAAGTYAHIVGNGTKESERSNAHTIDWDGNAWFAGTITAGDNKIDILKQLDILYNTFPFKIDGVLYRTEPAMTWDKWIKSSYNIDKFKQYEELQDRIGIQNNNQACLYNGNNMVDTRDTINPSIIYTWGNLP